VSVLFSHDVIFAEINDDNTIDDYDDFVSESLLKSALNSALGFGLYNCNGCGTPHTAAQYGR